MKGKVPRQRESLLPALKSLAQQINGLASFPLQGLDWREMSPRLIMSTLLAWANRTATLSQTHAKDVGIRQIMCCPTFGPTCQRWPGSATTHRAKSLKHHLGE